jgi:hypothetical protein
MIAYFVNTKVKRAFIMSSSEGSMPVLMAIGKNALQEL